MTILGKLKSQARSIQLKLNVSGLMKSDNSETVAVAKVLKASMSPAGEIATRQVALVFVQLRKTSWIK